MIVFLHVQFRIRMKKVLKTTSHAYGSFTLFLVFLNLKTERLYIRRDFTKV